MTKLQIKKNPFKLIEVLIFGTIITIISMLIIATLIWGCIIFFSTKAVIEVNEKGLKQSIEKVWNGPEKSKEKIIEPTKQ